MADGPRVAIRLGIVGDDEVKATLAEVGESGDAAAKRSAASWARASKDVEEALARQAKAKAQTDAVMSASAGGAKYTGDQNAQVKAYQQYMADQARAAEALRNAIEPLRVAQAAYDRELEVASSLLKSGNINETEYAAAVARSNTTLQAAKARLGEAAEGHRSMGASGMIAEHVVRSFSDSIAAGQSPLRAFTMESGRVVEGLALWAQQSGNTEGKVGALAAFMSGPFGLALSVGVAVLAPLVGKLFEGGNAADKMAERQKALADVIDRTTGRLKEQNVALLLNQRLSAQDDKGTASKDFTSAQRRLESLAVVSPDTTKAYQDVIQGKSGSLAAFTTLIESMQHAAPGIAQYARPLSDALKDLVDKGRQVQSINAQLRIMQGKPLPGDRKKAFGEFGADAPDLALADAKAKLAAATNATERAQAQDTITRIEARKAYADNGDLAAYTAAMTAADKAVGSAKQGAKDASAAAREHAKAVREAAQAYKQFLEDVQKTWGTIENGNREFSKKFASELPEQIKQLHGKMDEDQKQRMAPGEYVLGQLTSQKDALAVSQAELATVGMNADQRQIVLDRMKAAVELQRQGVDLGSDGAKAVLAGVEAQDRLNQAIERSSASMQEVRDFASQFVDDLASGKNVVKDLEQEFIKLALLNPLKNLISGNNNLPTLTSAFGSISKLFGGGGQVPGFQSIFGGGGLDGFASGTSFAPGGLAWVGENGPELMNVPRGASITPAGQSRRFAEAANNNGPAQIIVHVQSNDYFDARVASVSDGRVQAAAPGIAAGGAKLAGTDAAKARRRSLVG